jgi:hypothetical protein
MIIIRQQMFSRTLYGGLLVVRIQSRMVPRICLLAILSLVPRRRTHWRRTLVSWSGRILSSRILSLPGLLVVPLTLQRWVLWTLLRVRILRTWVRRIPTSLGRSLARRPLTRRPLTRWTLARRTLARWPLTRRPLSISRRIAGLTALCRWLSRSSLRWSTWSLWRVTKRARRVILSLWRISCT